MERRGRIEKLTDAQEARLAEFAEKWTRIGLCTDPADRAQAEQGIIESYREAGLAAPRIVWCDSPLSMALTRATILWDSVGASVRASVGDSVGASVRASVGDSVRDSVRASVRASVYGQHDAHWLGYYDYFREVVGLHEQTSPVTGLATVARNAGWWVPHARVCWVSERHSAVKQDAAHNLHCEDGPAVLYPDGWALYYWHGVRIPADIVEHPETITPRSIAQERNAEIRRVMLTKYGIARYIDDVGATEIDRDRDTKGERILYSLRDGLGEIKLVKLQNSTPERDGSAKFYTLRVDPRVRTCREAVAWAYGVDTNTYNVAVES